ncbi:MULTISPECIES: DUF992 domain-containing protein [unclassified Rhizobium]|uniref:DUF992 domain-containing protein n=1 Tax=unclassified Rhizobium TaxID=2613769 RepID=UPI001ADC4E2A|nr:MULTISPECIES: DUF992 domain-containing protein [unclassified Rhizobium]MBO9101336.1 DUF992 domain-containing protein [Rhizobium sp. L58/93]QXZ86873.1 DUF992 domain-containing protein [Rhizobium sp. K1/93]QXZ93094.1 DUF992 domain-containing protein [Rhizobium sp. K15/93]
MKKAFILAMAGSLALCSAASATSPHHHRKHPTKQVVTQPKERLGTLSCEVAGGIGLLIGSSKAVTCQFKQRTGEVERYTGAIGKLGLDVGITGKSYLSWVVVNTAPTSVGQGSLAGTYVGASAGASVGLGLGANALVGGNSKNFGLQPLSAEVGTGLNVAAGVSRLQLRPAS